MTRPHGYRTLTVVSPCPVLVFAGKGQGTPTAGPNSGWAPLTLSFSLGLVLGPLSLACPAQVLGRILLSLLVVPPILDS